MYGIENVGDPNWLVGAEIERITFGRYTVIIGLSEDREISLADFACYALTIRGETGSSPTDWDDMRARTLLPTLIGRRIAAVRTSDDALEFTIEHDRTLVLRDTSEHYETFTICGPGRFAIV
ncbi:MAG TPA: hypothetical protein PK765_02085 [bacterium]|nr:hypothetical protein [bacterium]